VPLDTIDVPLAGATLNYRYRGFKIGGRVNGHKGRLPRGYLEVLGGDSSGAWIHVAGEVVQGSYRAYVPQGRYWLEWQLQPPFPALSSRRDVVVSADTTIDLDVPYEEVRGRIRVRGVESAWEGGMIGSFPRTDTLAVNVRIRTDSHGKYFACLPAGTYSMLVQTDRKTRGIFPRMFSVSAPAPGPVETNLPAVSWAGTVRDSATGAPLDSILVVVFDSKHMGSLYIETDRRGRFRLLVEAGRSYTMEFWDSYRHRGRLGYRLSNLSASADTVFSVPVASIP